ncbi:MAG: hypothetical protein BWZ02_02206 [Lentisphaerae bacterium ADurb.BinA184]|nr:MAG: hypothetical protein BWZ02_02206 [Lentisphaerae bacterium ADurb.BinA184]
MVGQLFGASPRGPKNRFGSRRRIPFQCHPDWFTTEDTEFTEGFALALARNTRQRKRKASSLPVVSVLSVVDGNNGHPASRRKRSGHDRRAASQPAGRLAPVGDLKPGAESPDRAATGELPALHLPGPGLAAIYASFIGTQEGSLRKGYARGAACEGAGRGLSVACGLPALAGEPLSPPSRTGRPVLSRVTRTSPACAAWPGPVAGGRPIIVGPAVRQARVGSRRQGSGGRSVRMAPVRRNQ